MKIFANVSRSNFKDYKKCINSSCLTDPDATIVHDSPTTVVCVYHASKCPSGNFRYYEFCLPNCSGHYQFEEECVDRCDYIFNEKCVWNCTKEQLQTEEDYYSALINN